MHATAPRSASRSLLWLPLAILSPLLTALLVSLVTLFLPLALASAARAQEAPPSTAGRDTADFPARVLVTNDNGIDDPKIAALARALSAVSETWVVAPDRDRSGSGSTLSVVREARVTVEPRDLGPSIRAYAVDGFPADCVVLALTGLMRDAPPDIVVSGINGGPNLGSDWMFSGTIGAARVAAFAGVPAVALSGVDDDIPGALDAAVEWVVRLVRSEAARRIVPPDFLSVSFPAVPPGQIRGVRLTERAPLREIPRLSLQPPGTWRIIGFEVLDVSVASDSDVAAWEAGFIAVVPMRADEVDQARLDRWRRRDPGLPEWRGPRR
ncbi:MAG TPA: 5'/3'-nucleotidase SurE [Thermoanaerobaculia bacterium]|nr:5'/3'-nucleotidase SurE [Thermoanaerobaculia bacterium]